ncbi:hypothetical protein [Microbacterium arabinogalactanolyticum]|uniref:hypothetical protein n=1 Tax=Microbacterium arabinogalactanolyticum TaxID=69365 RepID=UPI002556B0D0|nr:hypothetical protein [Microbacterium arabinogalactanolyticum]GLC84755.1 hypothetical protein MIAR_13430 [Microbacterium arabinogalactanolyticum]
MDIVLLMVLAMSVGPLVIATAIRFLLLRNTTPLGRLVAILTVIAGLLPAAGAILPMLSSWIPLIPLSLDLAILAAVPLALGIVAMPLLMVPPRRVHTGGVAALNRRHMRRFVPVRWTWLLLALVVLVLVPTIAAGAASSRDEYGHYTLYRTSLGTTRIATRIYGWHYSVPSLIMLALLLAMIFAALFVITSRAWDDDIEADAAVRRLRAANVLRIGGGAILLHLFVILQSIAGTAGLRGAATTTELGTVAMGTPFAALQPWLFWMSLAAFVVGLTLHLLTALMAIPARRVATASRS